MEQIVVKLTPTPTLSVKLGTLISTEVPDVIKRYSNRADFPSLGQLNCLYIDSSENSAYLWDNTQVNYVLIASDWHNIKVINGGNAE